MNKENFLRNEINLDCVARLPINKTNPVLLLENITTTHGVVYDNTNDIVYDNNSDITFELEIEHSNYLYIKDWERYYFIDSITFNSNKMYQISCSLDVLMSFKNKEWTNNPLYITRRTNGNPFLSDNMIQFSYRKAISTSYSSDFTPNKNGYNFDFESVSYQSTRRKYCFVIAVAYVDTDDENYTEYKSGYIYRLPTATKNSTNSHLNSKYYVVNGIHLWVILRYFYSHSDNVGVIKNIMYLPYEIEYDKDTANSIFGFQGGSIDLGDYHIQIDEYPIYETKYKNFDRWKYGSIKIEKANSFMDYEPYTQAFLNIPFVEQIELELQKVRSTYSDTQIDIYYYVDYETGLSNYLLFYNDRILKTGTAQIGFKYTITTSNMSENQRAHENNVTNLALGSIATGVNSVSPSGFNPLKLASGLINNVSQYIQRENSIVLKSQASASSSTTGAIMFTSKPYIEYSISQKTFKGNSYKYFKENVGMPFNDYEFIYNITDGEHVIIGDTSDVSMSSDMTSTELELLRNALASGFYK